MRSGEGAAEWDKPIGVSALLHCQIKTPFWASKTPAAAVSPVIKMPLCLLSHFPILITNIYKQLNCMDRGFSLPGEGVGVSGYQRSCWIR